MDDYGYVIVRKLRRASNPAPVLSIEHPPWMDGALCTQFDPESFYPEKGGSTQIAKAVCASCDVQEQCLKFACDRDERFGVWGGLSERERRRLLAKGWRPGDVMPARSTSNGDCPHCGKSCLSVLAHIRHAHPEIDRVPA